MTKELKRLKMPVVLGMVSRLLTMLEKLPWKYSPSMRAQAFRYEAVFTIKRS